MASLSFDRHCAEITAQTALLTSHVDGADFAAPVPGCPGWTLRELIRHIGGAHRWGERIVRTRATSPVPEEQVNDVSGDPDEDPAALCAWLTEGAEQLAATLRGAGPHAAVWTVAPCGTPVFWARRMAHETVVHRADATFAAAPDSGPHPRVERFTVADDLAIDGLDEWMSFGSLPVTLESGPEIREFMGSGRSLRFQATDTAPEAAADWLVALGDDALTWQRPADAARPATVTVRGPLSGLLLLVYSRLPAGSGGNGVEVLGDTRLLDVWRETTGFWLRE
ncbi:maleylpyruvate isomerase N-terminal domain-containing protein [Streptomyces sp. CT34]|uniref:maleylpyruvate isomerase N-terminal domain-containing protein n=1 Tax=Streptomyces sp. CT34 TaxID=1553907 RepID=UPI0005B8C191|nr:maleylpyruvate isomerase N-terminal domain-containing protein [Streptomyces sp. CT34]